MTPLDPTLASLCLALLDGKRYWESTLAILADRVEELGDLAAAEALRSGPRIRCVDVQGRSISALTSDSIEIVLCALPEKICWGLMCDYAEHVLPIWERQVRRNTIPREALRARRLWLAGEISDIDMEAVRKRAWQATLAPEILEKHTCVFAGQAAARGEGGDAREAVRETARDCQYAVSIAAHYGQPEFDYAQRRPDYDNARQTHAHQQAEAYRAAMEAERLWQRNRVSELLRANLTEERV